MYCKFILNHTDMFRCQYTIFREFTVVLAKVIHYYIVKSEVKQSLYRPGVAQRVPGS